MIIQQFNTSRDTYDAYHYTYRVVDLHKNVTKIIGVTVTGRVFIPDYRKLNFTLELIK